MTKKERFLELLQAYQKGSLAPEQKRLLDAWYNQYGSESPGELDAEQLELIEAELQRVLPVMAPVRVRRLWPRLAVAASLLLVLSVAVYLFADRWQPTVQGPERMAHDVAPGRNQATLTLANGQKIILVRGLKGHLANQGATSIQAVDSSITYSSTVKHVSVTYNTLATGIGERSPYPLVLDDGTKVWLNAASSITFPTAFVGKERIVRMTGEAYFEVAHRAGQPFKVQSPGQLTEDVGTHFNVMSYADEPVSKVTLAEGAVKVNGHLIAPGEQAGYRDGEIKVARVDVDFALAWKNGFFRFNDASIEQVMRELARWYNVEVVYQGPVTGEKFNAKISRYKNISAVLRILERTRVVYFKIEGRRVTVFNKF